MDNSHIFPGKPTYNTMELSLADLKKQVYFLCGVYFKDSKINTVATVKKWLPELHMQSEHFNYRYIEDWATAAKNLKSLISKVELINYYLWFKGLDSDMKATNEDRQFNHCELFRQIGGTWYYIGLVAYNFKADLWEYRATLQVVYSDPSLKSLLLTVYNSKDISPLKI